MTKAMRCSPFALLSLCVACGGPSAAPAAGSTPLPAGPGGAGAETTLELGPYTFVIPPGFRAPSAHMYDTADGTNRGGSRRYVSVLAEQRVSLTGPEAIVQEILESQPGLPVDERRPGTLAGLPAEILVTHTGTGERTFYMMVAAARLDSLAIQLRYSATLPAPEVAATFEQILASAELASTGSMNRPAAGYTRRRAPPLIIDVPDGLPPRSYYELEYGQGPLEGSHARLLAYIDGPESSLRATMLRGDANEDRIRDESTSTSAIAGVDREVLRYRLAFAPPDPASFPDDVSPGLTIPEDRIGTMIPLDDGRRFYLVVSATEGHRVELERVWDELLRTFGPSSSR